jgi:predicted alpha/beta superfamily hydrolase
MDAKLKSALRGEPAPGVVTVLGPFEVPGLPVARHVRVYVPRGYASAGPHPVLVLFDGQNVFHDEPSFAGGWHAHDAVERVARGRRVAPVVVGIDHGGVHRLAELSPFDTEAFAGRADALIEWVAGAVVPALASRLHLARGPQGVVIGGSSMGGLAALYAHFRRPEVFGGALCMSPSLFVGRGRIFDYVAAQPVPWTSRVYLDCGAREGRGRMLVLAVEMARLLERRGYGNDRLMFRPDKRGRHGERDWRRRLPKALRFMFG